MSARKISCEHFYLRGNCPFCKIVELQKMLQAKPVLVQTRLGDAEVLALVERLANAELAATSLQRQLAEARRERDTHGRTVATLRRQASARTKDTQIEALRAELAELRALRDAEQGQPSHLSRLRGELSRSRDRVKELTLELRKTRLMLAEGWERSP